MEVARSVIHTKYGIAEVIVCKFQDDCCIPVLYKKGSGIPLVRIQSECFLGTVFSSIDCDCGAQVNKAVEILLRQPHSVFIYMTNQEARGYGLFRKIGILSCYQKIRNIEVARKFMGASDDMRKYDKAIEILKYLQMDEIELMTNDKNKMEEIENSGIKVVDVRGL